MRWATSLATVTTTPDGRTSTTNALNQVTTFAYDNAGNQTSVTDALTHTTQYQYDANNRRTTVIYPDNTTEKPRPQVARMLRGCAVCWVGGALYTETRSPSRSGGGSGLRARLLGSRRLQDLLQQRQHPFSAIRIKINERVALLHSLRK